MTLNDTSSAQDIIKESKDLNALSKVFDSLIARIKKQQVEALEIVVELAEKIMHSAQPYLIKALPAILDCVGHKKSSAEARALAEKASAVINNNVSPNAVQGTFLLCFPLLFLFLPL